MQPDETYGACPASSWTVTLWPAETVEKSAMWLRCLGLLSSRGATKPLVEDVSYGTCWPVLAVLFAPPLTVERPPDAVLPAPPLTVD